MNSKMKKGIALILALALVVVAGKFMSDYSLKATDGEENIVDDSESNDETTIDSESTEVVIGSDEVDIPEDLEETSEEEDDIDASEADEIEAEEEEVLDDSEEEDEGSVYITANVDENSDQLEGTKVVLTAHVEGYENTEYSYQWQKSIDGENWIDISGATDSEYTFTLTEETGDYTWRVILVTEA